MKITIRFYKEIVDGWGCWYADIPEHTKEENEMVMGSDNLLEILSNGENEITIEVSNKPEENYLIRFKRINHNSSGADYVNIDMEYETIWICNVTHTIFGEHPELLYITKIKDREI